MLAASRGQIFTPSLHCSHISVEKYWPKAAAETLRHQDEHAELLQVTLGRLSPSPSCCGPGKGESSLGEMETTSEVLNSFVHWGWRKKEMDQWPSQSRPICITRKQEGSADPRFVWFTQSVTCVWQNAIQKKQSAIVAFWSRSHLGL